MFLVRGTAHREREKNKTKYFLLIFFNERLSCGFPAHQNFSRDFCRLRPCVYSENVFEQLLRKTRCVAVWPSMEISPCARKDWNLIYTWLICHNSTREKTKIGIVNTFECLSLNFLLNGHLLVHVPVALYEIRSGVHSERNACCYIYYAMRRFQI